MRFALAAVAVLSALPALAVDFDRADAVAQFRVLMAQSKAAAPVKDEKKFNPFEVTPANDERMTGLIKNVTTGRAVERSELAWGKGYAKAVLAGLDEPGHEAKLKEEVKAQIVAQMKSLPADHPRPSDKQIDEMAVDAAKTFLKEERSIVEQTLKVLDAAKTISHEI